MPANAPSFMAAASTAQPRQGQASPDLAQCEAMLPDALKIYTPPRAPLVVEAGK